MKKILFIVAFLCSVVPYFAMAGGQPTENEHIYKSKVLYILNDDIIIQESGQEIQIQDIEIEILEGSKKGEILEIRNDTRILEQGDRFYLLETYDEYNDTTYYYVSQIDRSPVLLLLLLLFIGVVIIASGKKGLRSLLGLLGTFLIIIYVLLPGLTNHDSPVIISILVSVGILLFTLYITHGWNKSSSIALLGISITLVFTALLAYAAVQMSELTGFISEEAVYLNFNSSAGIDLRGLLLGGIIIGIVGVLDDIAVTQVSIVRQLWQANPSLTKGQIFKSAMSVGKDHTSSLVNTLVLAYTGVSLPLLLLFRGFDISFLYTINTEEVASEIIRTLTGSIGIIMCVPITTYLAVLILSKHRKDAPIKEEIHICAHCK